MIKRRSFLFLLDLVILGALWWAYYYGWLSVIWHADALKLSFLIIPLGMLTAFGVAFGFVSEERGEDIRNQLPMIALMGTVYGILSVFSVLAEAKFGSAGDFKSLIGPLLAGGGSAMWPTFLALAGANLLWVHSVVMNWGRQ